MFCVKIYVFLFIGLIVLESGLTGLVKTDVDDNNESGYFKKSNEAGSDGYQNYEKFDNKDGNEWGYEKAEAFGVSDHDDDSNDKTKTNYKDPHSYKVTEVQSEENKDDNSAKYTISGNDEVEEDKSNENVNDNNEYYQYTSDEDGSSNKKSEKSSGTAIDIDTDSDGDGDDDDEPSIEKSENTNSYKSSTYHEYPQVSAYDENESYSEADDYQNSHSNDESKDDDSGNDNDGIVDNINNEKNTKGIKIDKKYTKENLRDDNTNGCAGSKCENNKKLNSKLIEYANYEVYHQ